MRLITRPVDMLAVHIYGKVPRPIRFRFRTDDGREKVVKVERLLRVQRRKACDDWIFHYYCENGEGKDRRAYRLLYAPNDDKWEVYVEKR